jgi:sulfur-carrier protein adenylyltransferase/sulfurtransferase
MASFRDLLRETKGRIREVDTETAAGELGRTGTVILDVREPDEYEQGALPGAVHIPRGHLESQVEGRITDHDAHVVVYCAGGTRSAFAADTLGQLGYSDVVSVVGGFNKWKDEGRPGFAGGVVPGCSWCRHAGDHRHGRGRRVQSATPDPAQHGSNRGS